MKIILNVTSTLGKKTGIGFYVTELVNAMQTITPEVTIDTFPQGWLLRLNRLGSRVKQNVDVDLQQGNSFGQKLRNITGSVKRRVLRGLREVNRVTNRTWFQMFQARNGYQIYHEPNYVPWPINLPTIVTVPDLSVLLHPEWHPADRVHYFEKHFHKNLSSCQHFLTISDAVRNEMIRELGLAPSQVTTTLLGIRDNIFPLDDETLSQELKRYDLPEKYLLCLGTIEPRKNVLFLMQAYCKLPEAIRSEWPLLLVGKWGWGTRPVAEFYFNEARHRGVRHLGYVPESAMNVLYNGAQALLFPTHYEGFGLPPVEMMACGGAVIASTAEAVVEVAGKKAYLLDPQDGHGWTQAMHRIVTDDDWWESLRSGATGIARKYSWEKCARETLAVYRNVLTPQKAAA